MAEPKELRAALPETMAEFQEEPETVLSHPPAKIAMGAVTGNTPSDLVASASDAAAQLADVIRSRNLYSVIQGREFVMCEGWTTLAAMMGCLPREIRNEACEDGHYVAEVELVRMNDGVVMTRASAECGGGGITGNAVSAGPILGRQPVGDRNASPGGGKFSGVHEPSRATIGLDDSFWPAPHPAESPG